MAGEHGKPKDFRFFSDDSPFNALIPSDARVHPNSKEMIAANFNQEPGIWVNRNYWTIPVYWVDGNTPTHDIECIIAKAHGDRPAFRDTAGREWIEHTDRGFVVHDVPIPEDALPDASIALRPEINADAHLCLVDMERGLEWDFCWMAKTEERWFAGWGCMFNIKGPGHLSNYQGSARASGFALTAGLIFRDEIEAGRIEHALALALSPAGAGHVFPPGTSSDGHNEPDEPEWGIPEGARVQLDPELDVDSLDLFPEARTIARAMQKYGMYVCDNSGGINVYAEGFPFAAPNPWDGIMGIEAPTAIPVECLRVIDWGDEFCKEKEKPHNWDLFKNRDTFPPLPPNAARKVLAELNALREKYALPPYPG